MPLRITETYRAMHRHVVRISLITTLIDQQKTEMYSNIYVTIFSDISFIMFSNSHYEICLFIVSYVCASSISNVVDFEIITGYKYIHMYILNYKHYITSYLLITHCRRIDKKHEHTWNKTNMYITTHIVIKYFTLYVYMMKISSIL